MSPRVKWALGLIVVLALFQNFGLPERPALNIETRTVQKIDGLYQTTSPLIPANDYTLDGRVGLLRRLGPSGTAPFFASRPEKVIGHLKDPRNPRVGANFVPNEAETVQHIQIGRTIVERLGTELRDYKPDRSILCEKTEERINPRVCNSNKDCYHLTVVMRFHHKDHPTAIKAVRFAAIDVEVVVANPKSSNARIERVNILSGRPKLSPVLPFEKVAEPVIVGDNRLLIARIHDAKVRLSTATGPANGAEVDKVNIVYGVYSETEGTSRTAQCDPSRWRHLYPITHAHNDQWNRMKTRYKFARYPFRDGLGNIIPSGAETNGSYPWMDKDAANLFLTAYGQDSFYNFDRSNNLITPFTDVSPHKPRDKTSRQDYEEANSRTAGLAMMGFWTRGRLIQLDGLLNNADYNFTIVDRPGIQVARDLVLYHNPATASAVSERTGAVRERGNDVDSRAYHPMMSLNSTFIGSIENRLNSVKSMRPVTPRDVVWHFGTTRHQEEVAFDDYMNPHVFINAEMTAAVMYKSTTGFSGFAHLNGFLNGRPSIKDPRFLSAADRENPLMFQNATSAPRSYLVPPSYGRPYGNLRVEPIAKGGIHGKGLWLDGQSGLVFGIPNQSTTQLRADQKGDWKFSVFIDPRESRVPLTASEKAAGETHERILFSLPGGRHISLNRTLVASEDVTFNRIRLVENGRLLGSLGTGWALALRNGRWTHLAIQFSKSSLPTVFINGYRIGEVTPTSVPNAETKLRDFFLVAAGDELSLGLRGASTIRSIRGWTDDFKVIASRPTLEEMCNFSRGTLIRPRSSHPHWYRVAGYYPESSHIQVARALGRSDSERSVCFTHLGESLTPDDRVASAPQAHLGNIPSGAESLREELLAEGKFLTYGRPRPNFTANRFCLSCHIPAAAEPFAEMNLQALRFQKDIKAEDDPRRQPMQPARLLRGVIPKDYFGPGKPGTTLTNDVSHKVDQWLLRGP